VLSTTFDEPGDRQRPPESWQMSLIVSYQKPFLVPIGEELVDSRLAGHFTEAVRVDMQSETSCLLSGCQAGDVSVPNSSSDGGMAGSLSINANSYASPNHT